jgi:hypothetical protein
MRTDELTLAFFSMEEAMQCDNNRAPFLYYYTLQSCGAQVATLSPAVVTEKRCDQDNGNNGGILRDSNFVTSFICDHTTTARYMNRMQAAIHDRWETKTYYTGLCTIFKKFASATSRSELQYNGAALLLVYVYNI